MIKAGNIFVVLAISLMWSSCNKDTPPPPAPPAPEFNLVSQSVNGISSQSGYSNINLTPIIKLTFSAPVSHASVEPNVLLKTSSGASLDYDLLFSNADSNVLLKPSTPLNGLSVYSLSISQQFKSAQGINLKKSFETSLSTIIDSSRKFPAITDDELLTLVQKQTFKYFWDLGHPVSGLARERNNSGDLVTSGGSGFGIMAIIVAIHRNFITRPEGLARIQKMVDFLSQPSTQKYHGAFPHWLNGATGVTIPFSENDNGADIVETSYLMQGLLCARQYFNDAGLPETNLRTMINTLWNNVEWDWFRQNGQNTLYWHWSPDKEWTMNFKVQGWNEALITYVLAASSTTHGIPKSVYDEGWARNGAMKNNNSYYGYTLPLGEPQGGPLFFEHYSFLGIDPNSLTDQYADYSIQPKNHTLINYSYCKTNPKAFPGYSDSCWGLTASDIPTGYAASSPTNDLGVIAPTAAISSLPYTPVESMQALKFFYYVFGDKIWKDYGFVDAFSVKDLWFADSFLAIDQGPIIIMIENYRSGLLWNLLTGCPEVKTGLKNLGFQASYL